MCSNWKLKKFLSLVELPVSRCMHTMIVKVAMGKKKKKKLQWNFRELPIKEIKGFMKASN